MGFLMQAECQNSWRAFLQDFAPLCPIFRAAAEAFAVLDCLQSHAAMAERGGFCRPHFLGDDAPASVSFQEGRPPLLDLALPSGAVPNDFALSQDQLRMMVISGPNMGGKSCYMCQVGVTTYHRYAFSRTF
jgi:DNA mismatch repair protein MSH3